MQLLDDMGEDARCVCEDAKQQAAEALGYRNISEFYKGMDAGDFDWIPEYYMQSGG